MIELEVAQSIGRGQRAGSVSGEVRDTDCSTVVVAA